MKRTGILNKLADAGVIPVIRGKSKEQGKKACDALIAGEMTALEITFTIPEATELIQEVVSEHQDSAIVVGAGTVLEATTARLAIMAGAEFIVSPSFDLETAKICNLYQIPYIPGCMTITEIKDALQAGSEIIKLFPGSAYGPSMIPAVKAPLPHANIMPTGGVNLANLTEWFQAGAVAVGVGGNLLAPMNEGNYDAITEMAAQYMEAFRKIKEGSYG